ncbi:MAG: CDP-alcohol phosphatidyltransferase family protein [Kouleothrix sp.]
MAMATDVLDGPVARMRHEVSPLGKVIDPIADKLMIDVTAVALSQTRGFPWWATALLLGRDAAIVLGSALLYRRHAGINMAHPTGKATTLALSAAMLLYLADGPRRPAGAVRRARAVRRLAGGVWGASSCGRRSAGLTCALRRPGPPALP